MPAKSGKTASTTATSHGATQSRKGGGGGGGGGGMVTTAVIVVVSLLAYLYAYQAVSGPTDKLTVEERLLWSNFTAWLEANGSPIPNLKLAYFEASGRGVAAENEILAGSAVVVIPFKVMMNSGNMLDTPLGMAITSIYTGLTDDVFLSICLLYEKVKGDSFWKPYIDLLPTDFSNLPLFFTAEERTYLDGPMVSVMYNQDKQLQEAFETASKVEQQHPEFVGIANLEGLKWAISAVRSRMWTIDELRGRTLVPLADMLNHHPQKGVALDIQPEHETGIIKSNYYYPAGSEFFDKYYLNKVDSDHLYLMTFGFLMNSNDINTYQLEFNFGVHQAHLREIIDSKACSSERHVLSDADAHLPRVWWECLCIVALADSPEHLNIGVNNFHQYIDQQTKLRAGSLASTYLDDELRKFKKDDEQDLLLRPNLTNNMRNILLVRKSEKKVLRHGKDLLNKIR